MVLANSLKIESVLDETSMILQDNEDYLKLYNEVDVPHIDMERIVNLLFSRGQTCVSKLVDQLSKNEIDQYQQRRYVYALMYSGILKFNWLKPVDNDAVVWVNSLELI